MYLIFKYQNALWLGDKTAVVYLVPSYVDDKCKLYLPSSKRSRLNLRIHDNPEVRIA